MSKTKTCPNGHAMDPSWDRCPYCEAQKKSGSDTPVEQGRRSTIDLSQSESVNSPKRETIVGDDIPSPSPPQGRETIVLPTDNSDAFPTDSQAKDSRKIVAVLVSYSWVKGGQIFPVREGKNYIVRGGANSPEQNYDIKVPQDQRMSNPHALILCRSGKYEIIDQTSSNGTFLNGEILSSNLSFDLNNNDEIKTGSTLWIFLKIDNNQDN